MSIAGGVAEAIRRGRELGCGAIQLFTKNASRWAARPMRDDDVRRFHAERKRTGIHPVAVHDSYLINLASPERRLRERSIRALREELGRAERLGIPWIVVHPGAHRGAGPREGIRRIARALDRIHRATAGARTGVLLETTAGQGTFLGARFEELAAILDRVREPERIGICLDTCHLFAAGYELRTEEAYEATIEALGRALGLARVRLVHMNDSRGELGSRRDRHADVAEGRIGEAGLERILRDPRLAHLPVILETPKDGIGDPENLRRVRALRAGRGIPRVGAARWRRPRAT